MERAPLEHPHELEAIELVADSAHQYEILYFPEMRVEYLRLTDELVAKLVEQETDVAIFLDKSARPVAWLVKELWSILAPLNPKTGEQFILPKIKFLNIDREQWGAILGRSEDKEGGISVDRMPPERLEELRQIYAPVKGVGKETDRSLLTGKRVMVVDELRQSGDTLEMAEKILRKAFPDAAEIRGNYWMPGRVIADPRSGARVGKGGPIWYSDTEVTGRLVGNRDTTKSLASNSTRQQMGRYWLSTPFRTPDLKGRQLKEEVKWLADDLYNHRLIYMPSLAWDANDTESIDQRIQRINGISTQQFVELRRESNYGSGSDLNQRYVELMRLNQ